MFRIAYLEKVAHPRREERIVAEELGRRGRPFEWYTLKQIHRRQLPLGPDTFVLGAMDAMHGAMRQMGSPIPLPNDYPKSLAHLLRRKVWRSDLRTLATSLGEGRLPVFAKPADRCKSFTGRVFAFTEDLWYLGRTSRRQEIWCSDVVSWASEYRVYAIRDRIVGIDHYAGDPAIALPVDAAERAVREYVVSGEAPAAFALDLGVLKSGEVALVEFNDGYSLGAYQIGGGPYLDMLEARWAELCGVCGGEGTT